MASLQERLQVTEQTMQQVNDRWAKLSQDIADPNVIMTGDKFQKIRADQVREMASLAVKLVRDHPAVVEDLKKAYPNEFKLVTDFGIDIKDLADPFLGTVAEAALKVLLTQKLPKVKSDYAAHLQQEHDDAIHFLEDRKREIGEQIAALQVAKKPEASTGTDGGSTGSQPGTGDAGSQPGTGTAGGTDSGNTGKSDTGGSDTGGSDTGDLTNAPATKEAVTTGGGTAGGGAKPAAGSQPFDTAALENQAWPGTWEAQCKEGGSGKVEKVGGAAEFHFAGRTVTVVVKAQGSAVPLTADLDPLGAFTLQQVQEGGQLDVNGQFQNFDYGDGSYAPNGRGTFNFAMDLSALAGAVAGALTGGGSDETKLTPAQREANTVRCTGKWELPLPG
jgi:hypothetical protein